MNEPFDTECRNPGEDDRWTTPCCYADVYEEVSTCPKCGRSVKCSVDSQTVAVCRLVEEEN
jgi:hypothetical protein